MEFGSNKNLLLIPWLCEIINFHDSLVLLLEINFLNKKKGFIPFKFWYPMMDHQEFLFLVFQKTRKQKQKLFWNTYSYL